MFTLPLLLSCLLPHTVWGYNFDTLVPTIVSSGIDPSQGTDGFGFSIAQHEFSDGTKIALVSSPNIAGSDFFDDPLEREGGVFSCPFNNGLSCQFEPVFQSKSDVNTGPLGVPTLSTRNISYEGELLGFSIKSYGDHVVACAPLYVSLIQTIDIMTEHGTPNGRCIVLNRNLSSSPEDILQINDNALRTSTLIVAGVDTEVFTEDVSGNMVEKIAIGSVLSGGSAQGGSPVGQVVVSNIDPIGDMVSDSGDAAPPVSGLLGYRIAAGRFTENVLQIASSAPRGSMHHGYIRIFNIPNNGDLSQQLQVDGPQPNGYFGYDFTAYSFAEDGMFDSLIVGCPLCDGDRGAVYVFLHSGNPADPFSSIPAYIPSPASTDTGRFGMAVSMIGDIDSDGISDVAIAAPFEGSGVVYIYRGSRGGLVDEYQAIPASPQTTAFGYSLSGGLDIDNNGYPDLTISDLAGLTVTTVRTSPLVTVTLEFDEPQEVVDLVKDRKCQVNGITLLCFDVVPCFYYEPLNSEDVPQFAFQYTITVDEDLPNPRVVLLRSMGSDQFSLGTETTISDNITMFGAGVQNRFCPETYTFAIRADFVETIPIPVQLSVSESDAVPALPSDPSDPALGGALHPVLRRYIQGDQPATLDIGYEVFFGINCSGGLDDSCEPEYNLEVTPLFSSDPRILAPGNSFGYSVAIDNTAEDDGLSPLLLVDLPKGLLFNETAAITEDAVTNCTGTSQVLCLLRNPLPAQTSLMLHISFRFNTSAIPLTTSSLSLNFSVVDGGTGQSSASAAVQQSIQLKAEASFGLGIIITEEQYQAQRHALSQNVQSIPLNDTGPIVRFSVLVSNSRDVTNGTTIPTSTIAIHIPISTQTDRNQPLQPLLIPHELVSASGNINCIRYNTTPSGLSPIQQPPDFIPVGVRSAPSSSACQEQRGELDVKCGTIVCSVRELEAGKPPTQVNVFAYLFSPSVIAREEFKIFVEADTDVEGLTIIVPSGGRVTNTTASFEVLPAFVEVSLECFQYWIIVVSVVAGLLALLILVAVLACCGVFGRWYKRKGESPYAGGTDAPDNGAYAPRTIPPLPETTARTEPSTLEEEVKVDLAAEMEEEERRKEEEERRKEEEAEAERQPESIGDLGLQDIPLDQFTFDPHAGVGDSGEETEI